MSYSFSLPTTGAVSFVDYVDSTNSSVSTKIADATAQRGRLRAVLKGMKKETHSERDYQLLINTIEEYLPYLIGLVNCIESKEVALKKDIETSWRSTLSDHIIHTGSNAPRITCKDIQYELIFVLMTYAYACTLKANEILRISSSPYDHHHGVNGDGTSTSNNSHSSAVNADTYNKATNLLNTAAGVFHTVANDVIPTWQPNGSNSNNSKDSDNSSSSSSSISSNSSKPVETNREFAIALSKMTLADAQAVAISKALVTSNISKSLTAKLYMGVVDQYEMAFGLINSIPSGTQEVTTDLKKYLSDGTLYYKAMAKKYLAMDANHHQKMGQACGFARDAKAELKSLQQHSITKAAAHKLKKLSSSGTATTIAVAMKAAKEEEIVADMLSQYQMINDKVSYEPVPSRQELQTLIPGGRNLLELKHFALPEPMFGPSVKKEEKTYLLEGRYF
ncbi:BRO1 domain-containing protein [Mycotypha africana]|uniref:BRO1 domain-containing protein n=1 Tax=Mycotypha africana TaxID=64632 RepID=UPI00230157E8|nr:BRO1 domain-containing protein [Mycotypha africana]KAI8975183.1 BRO1 domain-containing protein [Mycotypha africana]